MRTQGQPKKRPQGGSCRAAWSELTGDRTPLPVPLSPTPLPRSANDKDQRRLTSAATGSPVPAPDRKLEAASPAPRVATRAFTLIELILVMAMLLTVLSLAAPSLARFFRGRHLEAEARRLLAATRYGQSRAVSEGVPVLLWINVESNQYGLRLDPSFTLLDTNALQFEWNEHIQVEAGLAEFATNVMPWQVNSARSDRLVRIYFQPDGTISDISPTRLRLQELGDLTGKAGEADGEIWITQSRNRLRYEIPEEPPPLFQR